MTLRNREKIDQDASAVMLWYPGFAGWEKHLAYSQRVESRSGMSSKVVILFNGKLCLLKKIPRYSASEQFVLSVTCLQCLLREAGLPIPEIFLNKQDKLFTQISSVEDSKEPAEEFYVLQDYIEGAFYQNLDEQFLSMGREIARFHNYSYELMRQGNTQVSSTKLKSLKSQCDFINAFSKRSILSECMEMSGFASDEMIAKYEENLTEDSIQKLRAFFGELEVDLKQSTEESLQQGYDDVQVIIHGDYHPNNVIFDEQHRVIGMVDFDNVCIDNPFRDIVCSILHGCYFSIEEETCRFVGVPDDFNQDRAIKFLEVYLEFTKIGIQKVPTYFKSLMKIITGQLCMIGLLRGYFSALNCEQLKRVYFGSEAVAENLSTEVNKTHESEQTLLSNAARTNPS